jgi:biopolymer transport protein ExbB
MLSQFLLGMSLVGAEWVLILLVLISVLSVTLIIERVLFFRKATDGLSEFRQAIRSAMGRGDRAEALRRTTDRLSRQSESACDLETEMTRALLQKLEASAPQALEEVAQDCVLRNRLGWDRNLALLATIGSNAPFVGLFGTVIGIIRAFADLAQAGGGAAQTVTAGISEALVATAVGILVAIPATVAFNLFQRRVRTAVTEAEALKNFLIASASTGTPGTRASEGKA